MVSRRDFLKISALSLVSLALDDFTPRAKPWPPGEEPLHLRPMKGRVTTDRIYIYSQPSFKSDKKGSLTRDTLVDLYEEVESSFGPSYNRRWYLVSAGYIHSGHVQRVEKAHLNSPLPWIPEAGQLAEVTVPFGQAQRWTQTYGWTELYRLYYKSVHWITAVVQGPDEKPWYRLTDELLHVHYCIPAEHMRPIPPEELAPISPEIPPELKKIEVSLARQALTAYEDGKIVRETLISSGLPDIGPRDGDIPMQTPKGRFRLQLKMPSKHMGDGHLTADIKAYELVGVPWVSFFHTTGVAFHGTYWHDNFGCRMSHGCVNMRNEDAKWLYRWTTPHAGPDEWECKGLGTTIKIT